MSSRMRVFDPRIPTFDGRSAPVAPKEASSVYHTPEYRRWRESVIARAGRRCEAVEDGQRCTKAEPRNRMFADHKIEVKDGGALHDPDNGECLCGAHHSAKTARARAARR